jgi:ligand-binding sensor domain-containing protein
MNGKPGDSSFDETTGHTVLSFAQDASGRVWLGTTEAGLFHMEDGKLVQFSDDYLKKRHLFALAFDADGALFVGSELGLRCYDAQGRLREISPQISQIESLLVDRHDVLWIGTHGMGLARYEKARSPSCKRPTVWAAIMSSRCLKTPRGACGSAPRTG